MTSAARLFGSHSLTQVLLGGFESDEVQETHKQGGGQLEAVFLLAPGLLTTYLCLST